MKEIPIRRTVNIEIVAANRVAMSTPCASREFSVKDFSVVELVFLKNVTSQVETGKNLADISRIMAWCNYTPLHGLDVEIRAYLTPREGWVTVGEFNKLHTKGRVEVVTCEPRSVS